MLLLRRIIGGLHRLFHKTQVEQELDEELRDFLETAAEQKMSTGLSREESVRAARVEIGSLEAVKDRARDVGWESVVDSVSLDLRYAIRTLRKSPGFTTVAILTLGLGIGANTAIFSVVNAVLLRPLPVVQPHRLVIVSSDFAISRGFTAGAGWNYGMWDRLRQRADPFDGAFAWSTDRFNLAQRGEIQAIDGVYVSGEYFSTLGVRPLLGRFFGLDDDVRGGGDDGPVAVISYRLWQRRFGGAASVVGTPVVLGGVPFTIVGVTPPEFFGIEVGRTFDVTLPLATEPLINGEAAAIDQPRRINLIIMLRLKAGESLDAATATLRAMQPQILEGFAGHIPPFLKDPFALVPAGTGISSLPGLRQRYERPLVTILVVVAVVLLIACLNLANLLLARATARRHELSVRLALGASKWRVARQLLAESFVLAGIGATLGLLFAAWGSRILVAQLSTAEPVTLDPALDWRVMIFAGAVTVATAILFGTAPAFRAGRIAPMDALKDAKGGTAGRNRANVARGLVVAQAALSLVLLVAAGLLVGTFDRLANVPLGFDRERVLLVNVDTARTQIDPAERNRFYQQLVRSVAELPGVERAAGSLWTPGGGTAGLIVNASGRAESERRVVANFVTPEWFAAYGIPLRAGRDISDRDVAKALPVVLINDALVRQFFPDRNPLGETFVESDNTFLKGRTVVGVVGDAIYGSLWDAAPPTAYLPLAQSMGLEPPGRSTVIISVRAAAGSPAALAPSAGAALTAVDPDVAFTFRRLVDQIEASLGQERLAAMLSAFFGILALLLAGVGLYGLTSYTVSLRTNEIGIRMALGAQRADIIKNVLRQSLLLTLAGILCGLTGAAAVTRYLESMLFGLTPLDPATLIAASLLFAAVSTVAAYLPARRASKVDPMIALRCE